MSLLEAKQNIWVQDRDACKERLKELSDYFGREHSLGKIESDEALRNWFFEMLMAVGGVEFSNSTHTHLVKFSTLLAPYKTSSSTHE